MDSWPRLPYGHPLGGCQQKLGRAREHLKLLDKELEVFTTGKVHPASIRGKIKADNQRRYQWIVWQVNEPDLRLAAVLGEFTHNLRSSLDHLIFELSFLDTNGAIPGKATAFPCCYRRGGKHGWNSSRVQSEKLAGISNKHRAMLYRTQPCYRRKETPKDPMRVRLRRQRHQLADLEALWNEDKHRTVMPVVYMPFQVEAVITNIEDCKATGQLRLDKAFLGTRLEPDTEVYSLPVKITGPNPKVDMDIKLAVEICLPNGLPAIQAFEAIYEWVESVLRWFQPEFETRRARALWHAPRGGWVERNPIRMRKTTYRIEPASASA